MAVPVLEPRNLLDDGQHKPRRMQPEIDERPSRDGFSDQAIGCRSNGLRKRGCKLGRVAAERLSRAKTRGRKVGRHVRLRLGHFYLFGRDQAGCLDRATYLALETV